MKTLGVAIGILVAWGLQIWHPHMLQSLISANGLLTTVGGIAATLTSMWAIAFGRLSAFEKLDDLTGDQKSVVIRKAGELSRAIMRSVATNVFSLVLSILLIALSPGLKSIPGNFLAYWLLGCFGLWVAGFFQSLRCIGHIESSRLAIIATQAAEKQRIAYLNSMQKDVENNPVVRDDAHLNKYTETYRCP